MEISIFLISMAVLAYQLILMRIFSITQWHHFAYMIISIALLGFGASGACLALFQSYCKPRFLLFYRGFATLFVLSIPISYLLSQQNPFNPFEVAWDARQYIHLLEYYLTLFLPFLLAAFCIGLTFTQYPDQIGKLYCYNLIGSGVGAAGAMWGFYHLHPVRMIYVLGGVTVGGLAATWGIKSSERGDWKRFRHVVLLAVLVGVSLIVGVLSSIFDPLKLQDRLHISPYKGLSQAQKFPDAQILAEEISPLGIVHAVSSPIIRYAPGLSLNYTGDVPSQIGLFIDSGHAGSLLDASALDALSENSQQDSPLNFLDFLTSSLAYHVRPAPYVLVLGAGGGFDVVNALYHQANSVDAVELDPQVIRLVRHQFRDFTADLYGRADVRVINQEARRYIETTPLSYDVIQIALLDAFAASSAGVHALQESYLYTVEAFRRYYARLTPTGILSITRWVKFPPRDNIKLFATAVEALEEAGFVDIGRHLIAIRSWATCTLLVSQQPFTAEEIERVRRFCHTRGFDLNHVPGILAEESNRYNQLPSSTYYEAAQHILYGKRQAFYGAYPYFIRPAHDDSPYFFQFFKWRTLRPLLETMGTEWVPFVEWGYLVLLATIVQAGGVSLVLILLPLVVFSRAHWNAEKQGRDRRWGLYAVVYFGCLGLGYLFLEIVCIQRFILFLADPTLAVSVVIASFLIFSGMGSLYFEAHGSGLNAHTILRPIGGIIGLSVLYLFLLPDVLTWALGWRDLFRILLTILLIAPLGFWMGIPFPFGMKHLSRQASHLVPWAYGINGCASVLSSLLATALAMTGGFRMVMLVAGMLYAIAAGSVYLISRRASGTINSCFYSEIS